MRTFSDQSAVERPQRFWAFCAKPTNYDIERAVSQETHDSWNVPRGDVRKGDRGVMWKAFGKPPDHRGIVALFEVLTDPWVGPDPSQSYWANPTGPNPPICRVVIRYVALPAPLWLDGPHRNLLSQLAVCRAHGGTVFEVKRDQWAELMGVVGGWSAVSQHCDHLRPTR
jgi:hypothetical protein